MRKIVLLIVLSFLLSFTVGCFANTQKDHKTLKKKGVELFLLQLKNQYNSVYEHWDELKLNTVKIMDKPLFAENEIEIMTDGSLKVNKEFFVAKGEGIDTGLLSEDNTNKTLKYEIDGKRFEVNQSSNNFLYNYYIHGVCVVSDGNRIIFVKQNDFNKAYAVGGVSGVERKTKKGAIGIPYVLVVDGKRNELGVIKIGEGDFAVPEIFDSWTYMGFPDNLPNLIPNASTLSKEQTD